MEWILVKAKPFFDAAERKEFQIVTSLVTLIGVLIRPLREGWTKILRSTLLSYALVTTCERRMPFKLLRPSVPALRGS